MGASPNLLASEDVEFVRRAAPATPPRFAELARVALLRDARTLEDDARVVSGSFGTVVTVHGAGLAYDVEIDGEVGIVACEPADLRPA